MKKKHIFDKAKKEAKHKLYIDHIKHFLETFSGIDPEDDETEIDVVPENLKLRRTTKGWTLSSLYLRGTHHSDPQRTEWILKSTIDKKTRKVSHKTYQLFNEGVKVPKRHQERAYADDYYAEDYEEYDDDN